MAATTANAIKAHLETLSLGVPIGRDHPETRVVPSITITEQVSLTRNQLGDMDAGPVTELVQVDLWQQKGAESTTLPGQVMAGLHGAHLPQAPTHVHGVTLFSSVRLVDLAENVVQHSMTFEIRRELT